MISTDSINVHGIKIFVQIFANEHLMFNFESNVYSPSEVLMSLETIIEKSFGSFDSWNILILKKLNMKYIIPLICHEMGVALWTVWRRGGGPLNCGWQN